MRITKADRSTKNQEIVIITFENGEKVSGFATKQHKPTGLGELKAGDDITPTIERNGQYSNITSFTMNKPARDPDFTVEPKPYDAQQPVYFSDPL